MNAVQSLPTNLIACPRCGELCKVAEYDGNEDARLLRLAKGTDGLCGNCAVTDWFQNGVLGEMFRGMNDEDIKARLTFKPIQDQFVQLMKVGNADMPTAELNWERIAKHWRLPFPKVKKPRKSKKH